MPNNANECARKKFITETLELGAGRFHETGRYQPVGASPTPANARQQAGSEFCAGCREANREAQS